VIKKIIFSAGILLSVVAPYLFPGYVTLLAFVWLMIVLSLSWDIIGGQMGYNSFGNIFFFGLGMYISAVVQRDMFSSGVDRFAEVATSEAVRLSQGEYFISLGVGAVLAAVICVIAAIILGMAILSMRGHYFAICTLGLGIAAGEIASGIDFIGAGSGMVTPLYPETAGSRAAFYYYYFFVLAVCTFLLLSKIYKSRFGLVLNAIRDDEDKAEAMGLHTTRYKTIAWSIAAFVLGIAGAGAGNLVGFIDPIDVAFTGATFGVWMILTVILGGKGTLWGPVIGAIIFYATKELFWTYLLGWQRVALGLLIVVIVVFFPTGILGWMRERWPHRFGERVEEAS
jgi:branched-chain amino acid transport system permease protein